MALQGLAAAKSSRRKLLLDLCKQLLARGSGRAIAAIACFYLALKWWKQRRFATNVPYVKGLPLLGNVVDVCRQLFAFKLHDQINVWHQMYGKTMALDMAGQCIVMTFDPKNIEHVLKDNFDNYIKGALFSDPFQDLLGDGIFNADGAKWYHQRKTASRMFTKKSFDTHIQLVMQANVLEVTNLFQKTSGQEVDIFNIMNRFTLDTIGMIGFSRNIGSLADPSSPFLKSFDYVQGAMFKRTITSQSFPTFKLLRALGALWEKELPEQLRLLNEFTFTVVDDLLRKVAEGDDNSFVGIFAKNEESQEFQRRDPQGFRVYMRDMVLNFLLAGRDTTASALTWTIYELAQRADIVAKVREDVSRVCGDRAITYQDVNKLSYVRAVLDEGLRLHPSVPLDSKIAVADDILPDGTVVRAGCVFNYTIYAQGRSTEFWGDDAEHFRPERWLERESRPTSYEFVVFNAGKRECLGKRLAEMEMVTMVASLFRDFDIALVVDPAAVHYDIQLTLGCSTGLPAILTPRNATGALKPDANALGA